MGKGDQHANPAHTFRFPVLLAFTSNIKRLTLNIRRARGLSNSSFLTLPLDAEVFEEANTDQLGRLIYEIRGERVMLDSDLTSIYCVETKSLNRAVKRNADRFPRDFMLQISADEWQNSKYQIGTSSSGHGGRRRHSELPTCSLHVELRFSRDRPLAARQSS